jgi:hypothetical protein
LAWDKVASAAGLSVATKVGPHEARVWHNPQITLLFSAEKAERDKVTWIVFRKIDMAGSADNIYHG